MTKYYEPNKQKDSEEESTPLAERMENESYESGDIGLVIIKPGGIRKTPKELLDELEEE